MRKDSRAVKLNNNLNSHQTLARAIHETLEARCLLRANVPGSYDPTFGVGGISNLDQAITPGGQADAVAIQTNGDIVVAGYQYPQLNNNKDVEDVVLLRYLPNGDLDPSFGVAGKILNTDAQLANAVAVEPNGDIVVAGRSNGDFYAARYTTSGQLDPTFGRNGEVKFDLGARDTVQAMAITAEGKITLAGSSTASKGGDFAVVRLSANGSIDTTFGTGGKTFIDFNGYADGANDVKVVNNKIYLTGYATTKTGNTDFAIARLNLNGSLDTTYAAGGKTTTDFAGENAQILRMAIKTDGTITVAGYVSTDNNNLQNSALAQYTPTGHLDSTFGSNGTVIENFATPPGNIESQQLTGIAYRSNGSIVVSGWVFDPTYNGESTGHQYEWTAANFSASGTLLNQNAIGFQYGGSNFAYNMTLDASGHAVLVGQRQTTNLEFGVARLNTDLTLDTTFGRDEKTYLPYAGAPNPQDAGSAATTFGAVWGNTTGITGATIASVVQPDGKVILGGYNSQSTSAIIRLNADGSLDTSFNVTATVQLNGEGGPVLLLQPDGKLLAVNFGNIVRLNTDGSLDTTFAQNGVFTPASGRINGVALGPNSTIYIAGDTQFDTGIGPANFELYRLTSTGALDNSFGVGGIAQIVTAQPQQQLVTAITVQPDGKIVLAGQTLYEQQGGGLITRFNADGTLDTTFGNAGFFTYQSNADVSYLAMQGNDVLFAGLVQPPDAPYQLYMGRLTPMGQLDTSFATNGTVPLPDSQGDTGIVVAADGSILVGGQTINSSAQLVSGVYRYTVNGTLDKTFGAAGFTAVPLPVGYASATVSSIALAPNNELVASLNVYPEFSNYNDYGAARILLGSTSTANTPLTGTVIGTSGSYQNDGNTIAKAFDGILTNYFDGPTANGDYAGLDLGTAKVITQIGYDPRAGFNSRMIGGIFQGSNSASFTNATTLYTVSTSPASATLTLVSISNPNAFRYVRYLAPNGSWGDVGELAFYGTAATTPTMVNGATIGTAGSYKSQGNTTAKVFDGSLSTYFDAPVASGSWVGLDLGSAQVVTQVSYAPRTGWESRMVGGMIQASNTADFSSGVVTLYTINSTPTAGVLTTASLTNSTAYRYYRYIGPANGYCNIAELELFV